MQGAALPPDLHPGLLGGYGTWAALMALGLLAVGFVFWVALNVPPDEPAEEELMSDSVT